MMFHEPLHKVGAGRPHKKLILLKIPTYLSLIIALW